MACLHCFAVVRQLASASSGTPLFEVFIRKDREGYHQQVLHDMDKMKAELGISSEFLTLLLLLTKFRQYTCNEGELENLCGGHPLQSMSILM